MSHKKDRKSINLFHDKEIRCYKVVFNITDEEDLLQWWEYQLDNSIEKYQDSIKFLHALYRACYHLMQHQEDGFDIIFEKSQENVYWTIWAKDDKTLNIFTCKECSDVDIRKENERISFKLSPQKPTITQPKKEVIFESSKKILMVYTFLDEDDKASLIDINSELADEIIYLENRGFCEKSISKIQKLLSEYSFILSNYREVFHIKENIEALSYYMNENRDILIALDASYVSLFEGSITNLQNWFDALFVHGATSVEAYKDSITADVEIIKTMTQPYSNEEDTLEFF